MYAKQTSHTLPSVQGNGTGGSGTGGSGTNGSGGGALVGAAIGSTTGSTTGGTTGFFVAGPVGAVVGGAVGGTVGAVSVWQLLCPYINVIHQSHTFYFIPRLSGGSKVEQASTVYVHVVLKI